MQPHKYQTDKNNNFLQPAGYTFANTDHHGVSLHHQGPSVTCIQFVVHQNPQDLLVELFSSKFSPNLYCCMGLTPSQVQDFTFTFVKHHDVSVSPFLKLVKIHLNRSPALQCINYSPQFDVVHELAETAFCPMAQVTDDEWQTNISP